MNNFAIYLITAASIISTSVALLEDDNDVQG